MEWYSIKMILLCIVGALSLSGVSFAQQVLQSIDPEKSGQCIVDTKKISEMRCQLFLATRELEELKEDVEEVKEAIQCGSPPSSPPGGISSSTGTRFSDKTTYWCHHGYKLEGKQVLKCKLAGKWEQAPCCRKDTTGLTLTDVDWRRNNLTDTDLTGRLQTLSGFVRELNLRENKLTQIPALGEYTQLDTLEWLSFYSNEIVSFEWDQIPTSITTLDLGSNKLSMLPVVGEAHRCLSVMVLRLYNNNLQTLEASQLPVSLTRLFVSHNKLSTVPDLSSLPLTRLGIGGNLLTDINVDNLPVSLTKLYLSGNHLTQVPDLSHLPLTVLDLSDNPLTELNGHKLPVTLSGLGLHGDRITVSGVSHLVNLKTVHVSDRNIQYYRETFPQARVS